MNVHTAHQQYLAGEYESALESLSNIDDYASSYIVRSEVLLAMGEMDEALATVKQALDLCPNSPRGILLLESIGRVLKPKATPTLSELFDEELPATGTVVVPSPVKLHETPIVETPDTELNESPSEAAGLISETLAKLMVKQGKFAEARKVYIQLSRKHPERYDYFRRQMHELVEQEKSR